MIRMRNLQRNHKKEIALKSIVEVPPESEEKCTKMQEDLDTEDEGFNPEALEMKHTKPEVMKYPKVALPHSQPVWDRGIRIGRGGEGRAAGRLTDWHGQFTGVEEEEGGRYGWQGREGRQWTWNKMNENSRKDEFESWREEKVDGFCKLDSHPHLVKSPEVCSPDKISSLPSMETALPDVAHLKKMFPLNKLAAPQESSPEPMNLHTSSQDQVFTKIKPRVTNNHISRINSIISQSSSRGPKPLPVQASKLCDRSTGRPGITGQSSEFGHEEQKLPRGSTHLPTSTNIITVRAKLITSPAVSTPLPGVAAAQAEPP